jgi:hypothetical protein
MVTFFGQQCCIRDRFTLDARATDELVCHVEGELSYFSVVIAVATVKL